MSLKRRGFIKWSLLTAVAESWPRIGLAKVERPEENSRKIAISILQGATDESHTQFSVLHGANKELSFLVQTPEGANLLPDRVEYLSFQDHPQVLTKPFFSGLQLGQEYRLLVLDFMDKLVDERFFRTLDLEKDQLRFTVASCMDDERHEPQIWQDMVAQNPDFILFVGDSVYADRNRGSEERVTASPALLWRRFCQARETLEIYNSRQLVPILATWDDHDFGKNDTGDNYPYIAESQKNFLGFFAQSESHCRGLIRGPGVSSALLFKNQTFLLLDDRSFRKKVPSRTRLVTGGKTRQNGFAS